MTIAQINAKSVSQYGVAVAGLDSTAALWLADKILAETGKNEFKKISSHRHKYGLGTAFPQYGSELFKTL